MRRITMLIFFVSFLSQLLSSNYQLKEQLNQEISRKQNYVQNKEDKMPALKSQISYCENLNQLYLLQRKIFSEYVYINSDSAIVYIQKNENISDLLGDTYRIEVSLDKSLLLTTYGQFAESLDILSGLEKLDVKGQFLSRYYELREQTYLRMMNYTQNHQLQEVYKANSQLYADSLFSMICPKTREYYFYGARRLLKDGKEDKALKIYLALYKKESVKSVLYARITQDIANIYKSKKNLELYESFLLLTAISNQICLDNENWALQELSLLYKSSDPKQAYNYIKFVIESGSRLMPQTVDELPSIIEARSQHDKQIYFRMGFVLILSGIVVFFIFLVYRKKSIAEGEIKLPDSDDKLKIENFSHIRMFIDLCSSHIEKLNNEKEMIRNKVLKKEFEDLPNLISKTTFFDCKSSDLFNDFDKAFLNIYPTFVKDFNMLLKEGSEIVPENKNRLNRELRIFALIRLGIADSGEIATFLRYSRQTIYNNRTKVRNLAKNRETFEKDIINLNN